ncbi:MFS transporter [Methylosinus sp. Sm6]|uniref:MFS transporter n=1 Tax=Methylosinus sp. Sm6 TaxID=2866948 RepID=UPI001C996D75|nr:MFS transporter [Methylosinus sp. Sm6]MBY6243984.1 MFS transporter [Methylosinus sp. Sm6]
MRDNAAGAVIESTIPARLDALPWGRFHTLVVVALGVTWILDGIEVSLAGAVAGVLREEAGLGLSSAEVGLASSAYLLGAVLGALLFGWMTDRLGRRKLFFITLAIYLVATAATAASFDAASFILCRFFVGAGIGGEYAAVSSTIQELVPARVRGWTDLVINGSFWVGAAAGAAGTLVLLDWMDPALGWRAAFLIGAVLGLLILLMRRWIPESPRWLMLHGFEAEAEKIVAAIEQRTLGDSIHAAPSRPVVRLRVRWHTPVGDIARAMFRLYPRRTLVALSLMASQAFLYNAIFFTYALALTDFYGVPAEGVGLYLLPLAAGNFLGPVLLGHFFDSLGRKVMISATYAVSGVALLIVGYLFAQEVLNVAQQTAGWMIVFFFASAAASSAYLTVSETFPLEIRAIVIAIFYAFGTALGGVASPFLFATLIDTGRRWDVFAGYAVGAVLMIAAALVEWRWGVAAERKSLEEVCPPLTAVDE